MEWQRKNARLAAKKSIPRVSLSKNAPNAVHGSATTTWASINFNAFCAKPTPLPTNTTTLTAISAESAFEQSLEAGHHRHRILRAAKAHA
jgi:hypothetical protein